MVPVWIRRGAVLTGVAAAAGCGSQSTAPTATAPATAHPVVERSYGKGAEQVWVFRRRDREPKAIVVFLHGLYDKTETTPANHLPFLRHLASRDDAVIFPRYEQVPGQPRAVLHALKGTLAGMRALNPLSDVPVVVMGYSRGGGLALDVAALAPGIQVVPKAVLAIFPAMLDPPVDYRSIPASTPVVFLVGDRDTNVSHYGRDNLVTFMQRSHRSLANVKTELIRSTPDFTADHVSFMTATPAARRVFWRRADRIVDEASRN